MNEPSRHSLGSEISWLSHGYNDCGAWAKEKPTAAQSEHTRVGGMQPQNPSSSSSRDNNKWFKCQIAISISIKCHTWRSGEVQNLKLRTSERSNSHLQRHIILIIQMADELIARFSGLD